MVGLAKWFASFKIVCGCSFSDQLLNVTQFVEAIGDFEASLT